MACASDSSEEAKFSNPNARHLVAEVSTKKKTFVEKLASDEDWEGKGWTGLFLSNGPGDPSMCSDTVKSIQYVMEIILRKLFLVFVWKINCWRLQVVLRPSKFIIEIVV